MSGKGNYSGTFRFRLAVIVGILAVGLSSVLYGEIIRVSQLQKEKKEFLIKRDIFSPVKRNFTKKGPAKFTPPPPPPPKKEEKGEAVVQQKDIEAEVRQSVAFEGYVVRNAKRLALMTVNGEFFVVGPDDIVLNRIKVLNVDRKKMTIEVESNQMEIKLKGDNDDDE